MASPGRVGTGSPTNTGQVQNRGEVKRKLEQGKGIPIDVPKPGTYRPPDESEIQRHTARASRVSGRRGANSASTSSPYKTGKDNLGGHGNLGESSRARESSRRTVSTTSFYGGGKGPKNDMKDSAWREDQNHLQHRNASRSQQGAKKKLHIDLVSDEEELSAMVRKSRRPSASTSPTQQRHRSRSPTPLLPDQTGGKGKGRARLDMGSESLNTELEKSRPFTVALAGDTHARVSLAANMKGKDPTPISDVSQKRKQNERPEKSQRLSRTKITAMKENGETSIAKSDHLGDEAPLSLKRAEEVPFEMELSHVILSGDEEIDFPPSDDDELIDGDHGPRACIAKGIQAGVYVTLSWDNQRQISIALDNISRLEHHLPTRGRSALFLVKAKAEDSVIVEGSWRPKGQSLLAFACFLENSTSQQYLKKQLSDHRLLPASKLVVLNSHAATALLAGRDTLCSKRADSQAIETTPKSCNDAQLHQNLGSRDSDANLKRSSRDDCDPVEGKSITSRFSVRESPQTKRTKQSSASPQIEDDKMEPSPATERDAAEAAKGAINGREASTSPPEETARDAKPKNSKSPSSDSSKKLEKIFSFPFEGVGAIHVFESDLEKLEEGEFLNDTLIEFGLKYILEEIKMRDMVLYESIYVFSSFFWKRFTGLGKERRQAYEFVRKWTAKVDIFSKKYLVIPINENLHWYLALVINPHFVFREPTAKTETDQEGDDISTPTPKTASPSPGRQGSLGPGVYTKLDAAPSRLRLQADQSKLDEEQITWNDKLETPPIEMRDEARRSSKEIGGSSESDGDVTMRDAEVEASDAMEVDEAVEIRQADPLVKVWDDILPTSKDSPSINAAPSLRKYGVRDKRSRLSASHSGPSDGLRNAGQGTMLGGGGRLTLGTPIKAGETFEREMEREIRTREDEQVRRLQEKETQKREAQRAEEAQRLGISTDFPISVSDESQERAIGLERRKSSVAQKSASLTEKLRAQVENFTNILTFDSLGNSHKGVRTVLRDYLCYEARDKRQASFEEPKEIDERITQIQVGCPTQTNYCDCGLFLLHFVERFFHDPSHMLGDVIVPRLQNHDSWQEESTRKAREVWKERAAGIKEEFEERRERRSKELSSSETAAGKSLSSPSPSPVKLSFAPR